MMYLTPEEALDLYKQYGSIRRAAREAGIPRTTFRRRLNAARELGEDDGFFEAQKLNRHISELKRKIRELESKSVTSKELKDYIHSLSNYKAEIPKWLDSYKDTGITGGVPSIILSDLHWSEVVDKTQVFGKNSYNLDIASKRLHTVIDRVIDILFNEFNEPDYPGIVVNLAGDMISGDIHDELTATNEKPVMPTFIDLYENMVSVISRLADTFGNVFVPCVHGNHSRNTKKIQAKDQAYTNFDWLLYNMLAKYFNDDNRVSFLIASGADIQYKVYNHVYRLTHGNQFRGGSGIIGFVYPVMRGQIKKHSAAATYNNEYDTLLLGHFHSYMTLGNIIVNGSLVGYNEYALSNNLPFEMPMQALWITNPRYGITTRIPVLACDVDEGDGVDWVSIPSNS